MMREIFRRLWFDLLLDWPGGTLLAIGLALAVVGFVKICRSGSHGLRRGAFTQTGGVCGGAPEEDQGASAAGATSAASLSAIAPNTRLPSIRTEPDATSRSAKG